MSDATAIKPELIAGLAPVQIDKSSKPPSAGKTAAVTSGATASGIIVFMYVAKHLGLNDMDLATASAFVGLIGGFVGWVMHNNQRTQEAKGN